MLRSISKRPATSFVRHAAARLPPTAHLSTIPTTVGLLKAHQATSAPNGAVSFWSSIFGSSAPPKPGVQDMTDAKLLYVKLKINYTENPELTSLDGLKYVLGEMGATAAWSELPGLRHKYFVYNEETQTCSGVYVFFDQASLDAYMASELFSAQSSYPHVSEAVAEVHDVLVGTEKSIENYDWASSPLTPDDVSKAWMLIAHLKVKTDVTPEPALREFMATQYTEMFNKENGPKDLRGKYFAYNADTETVSGFYTFLDKASMEEYMASDLWKGQSEAPNIESATFSTHEVLTGTERAMDLGSWKGK